MQNSLFGESEPSVIQGVEQAPARVDPAPPEPALIELGRDLAPIVRLGTSSWNYPGWAGLVWGGQHAESALSRHGLTAYALHPLLRTVGIDRGFYRPLSVAQFAEHAAQVGEDFRFVLKAPSAITDALVRDRSGRGTRANPSFLDAAQARQSFVEPALEGLGHKLGVLVFQISPLPAGWLTRMPRLFQRLRQFLAALPDIKRLAPDAVVAVEVRDPQWLTAEFAAALRDSGATYCLGLNAKMPPIAEQLPTLRALWPGPCVCRWNLNPLHGAYGYEVAEGAYSPFDKMVDPDPETRAALVRVIQGTAGAGENVYVTISNQAEGCAPLSVIELARSIRGDAH